MLVIIRTITRTCVVLLRLILLNKDNNRLLLSYIKPEANNSKAMQACNAVDADNNAPDVDNNALVVDNNTPDADNNALDADNNAVDADNNAVDADNNAPDADNNTPDADNNASKKGCGGHCQPTIA